MSGTDDAVDVHDIDVTVWVGKAGSVAVTDELDAQLDDRDFVKVRFHRSALADTTTAAEADALADAIGGSVVDVRGHTGVFTR